MIAPKVVSHVAPAGRDYRGTTSPDLITSVPKAEAPAPSFVTPTCGTCGCACAPEADGACKCGCLDCGCGLPEFTHDRLGTWRD
jgi:hypothetical protein